MPGENTTCPAKCLRFLGNHGILATAALGGPLQTQPNVMKKWKVCSFNITDTSCHGLACNLQETCPLKATVGIP